MTTKKQPAKPAPFTLTTKDQYNDKKTWIFGYQVRTSINFSGPPTGDLTLRFYRQWQRKDEPIDPSRWEKIGQLTTYAVFEKSEGSWKPNRFQPGYEWPYEDERRESTREHLRSYPGYCWGLWSTPTFEFGLGYGDPLEQFDAAEMLGPLYRKAWKYVEFRNLHLAYPDNITPLLMALDYIGLTPLKARTNETWLLDDRCYAYVQYQ